MHKGKQERRSLTVRLTMTGYDHISDRANREDVDVSRMVRRMLAYASANMPTGWVPPKER